MVIDSIYVFSTHKQAHVGSDWDVAIDFIQKYFQD